MTEYSELVKALRYCAESGDFNCNKDCPMYPNYPKCLTKMDMDAAAAIEALQAELEKKRTADCWGCKCEKIEPKRGEWIEHGLDEGFLVERYTCSNCDYYSGTKKTNFCPNCGAVMEDMCEVQE